MRKFVIAALCVAATVSSAAAWGVSSQFQKQDGHGGYAYGYEDPNSQKQEQRSAHGVVHGGYSYVDGAGKVQHVKYVADPKEGFHIVGASNLPEAPRSGAGAPIDGRFGYDHANIVIGHGGVPIDTPEVQHARAQHLAALSQVKHSGPQHRYRRALPVAPHDTPEVEHAKQQHFAAYAVASGYDQSWNTGAIKHVVIPYHGPQNLNTKLYKGVPLDTPEVVQARDKHFNSWTSSRAAAGQHREEEEGADDEGHQQQQPQRYYQPAPQAVSQGDYYKQAAPQQVSQAYKGPIHVPVIHQGVPVETPEVQHARAAHLTALAKAHAEAGPYVEQEEENEKQWN